MKINRAGEVRALTLIEVSVIIAVLAILLALVFPFHRLPSVKSFRIVCANNLKQVGLSFRLFETDHGGRFPMQLSTNRGGTLEFVEGGNAFRHFQILSNELTTPKVVLCPADRRQAATSLSSLRNEHLSYFVGLGAATNDGQMLLAGDRNLTNTTAPTGGILVLTTNQTMTRGAGWTEEMHQGAGNVALADGSVQQLTTRRLRDQLRVAGTNSQHIALP